MLVDSGFHPRKRPNKSSQSWLGAIVLACFSWIIWGSRNISFSDSVQQNRNIEEISASHPVPGLLVSVPFYVYAENLAWTNATIGTHSVAELAITPPEYTKHADDYWLLKASLEHPLRTSDPSRAKLFFVPTLMNLYLEQGRGIQKNQEELCWNNMCNLELWTYTESVLNESIHFQQSPHLHVYVNSHWRARPALREGEFLKKLPPVLQSQLKDMHVVSFEDNAPSNPNRMSLPSYYVGTSCQPSVSIEDKTQDVALIASLHPERYQFADRRNICTWIRGAKETSKTGKIRMTHCGGKKAHWATKGALKQCPALGAAKFGFHARGDTFGSNRLMDILLSGTVPIFTHPEQYQVLPSWIDWNMLSYYIPMSNTTKVDFLTNLKVILDDESGYRDRYQAILDNMNIFDYMSLNPFDTYMYMLQAQLYPETRHVQSNWTALILP